MHRMCHNEFQEDHEVTVGVEFGSLLVKIREVPFKMQIWDTAGQESFQSITKIFYRGAHAVLLTYDITSMDSFLHCERWFEEAKNQAESDSLIFLIGNKSDREADREVPRDKAQQFATQRQMSGFFETSAKTGDQVEEAFMTAARRLFKQHYRAMMIEKQRSDNKPKNRKLRQQQQQAEAQSNCGC